MWHCTEGKDRCGLLSAIILSVLDVDVETIFDDYLLTNKGAVRKGNKYYWLVVLAYHNLNTATRFKGMYIAKREYLESAFKAIEDNYGGMDSFIENQLGVTKEIKQSFKEYMTE